MLRKPLFNRRLLPKIGLLILTPSALMHISRLFRLCLLRSSSRHVWRWTRSTSSPSWVHMRLGCRPNVLSAGVVVIRLRIAGQSSSGVRRRANAVCCSTLTLFVILPIGVRSLWTKLRTLLFLLMLLLLFPRRSKNSSRRLDTDFNINKLIYIFYH